MGKKRPSGGGAGGGRGRGRGNSRGAPRGRGRYRGRSGSGVKEMSRPPGAEDEVQENGEPLPVEPGSGILELHPNGYGFLRSPSNNYSRERTDPFVPGTMIDKFGLREGVLINGSDTIREWTVIWLTGPVSIVREDSDCRADTGNCDA